MNVFMVQFMKIGYTGEAMALSKFGLPVTFESFNVKCKNQAEHDEEIKKGTFAGYCRECFVPNAYDNTMAEKAFNE